MSTKTLRKRIALVAVVTLGLSLMSVAPSSAKLGTGTDRTCSAATGGLTVQAGVSATIGTCTVSAAVAVDGTNADGMAFEAVTGPEAGVMSITGVGTATGTAAAATVAGSAATLNATTGTTSGTAAQNVTGSFDLPGVYTVKFGTFATAVTVTVVAGSSTTTSLTATTGNSGAYVTGATPVITVSRNTGGVLADGTILARVTATPDTVVAVGDVLGEGIEGDIAITTSTNARVFTFANTFNVAGTYSFTFWADTNANAVQDSSEVSTTGSFVVSAAAASTSLISATLSRTIGNTSAGVNTVTVTASITDADGNPTTGSLLVAETDSTGAAYVSAAANINGAGFTTASNAIGASGTPLTRVGTTNTYTGTFTIDQNSTTDYTDTYLTVYIDGTIAATATTSAKKALRIAATGELTTVAGVSTAAVTDVVGIGSYSATTGVRESLSTQDLTTDIALTVDRTVLTHSFTFTAAAGEEGEYLRVVVAPLAATSSTVVAPVATLVAIGADLTAKYSVTAVAPIATDGYTLTVTDGSGDNVVATMTFATAAPRWSVSPSASFKAKFGDTSTVTGTLSDQFGRVLGGKAVYVLVTGRQAGTYNGTTAADGTLAFKWTDTNAATTVTLTDVLTFNYPYFASATSTTTTTATSASRTVTYSATGVAVGSVTVAAPSATNTRPIDVDALIGLPGAGSRVVYTATVRDAAGLPVTSGALVTFTGGADDLFFGGNTGVTDEFGQASVTVYRNKVGAPAIKATAGGVTSAASAAVQWTNDVANATAASAPIASSAYRQARYIALKADTATAVSQGVLRFTATVTDRWGNAVAGVQVTFAETGAGRFFNPPTSNQVTTNAAGEASIDLNSQAGETGTASVTAAITSAGSVQAINEDSAGFVTHIVHSGTATDAAGTFTGTLTAVAGVTAAVKSATATATITKDTSTSTADALLALATALGTRDQASAAVDAAAEATDAANAATDAANAAAEAADAATAAAQDAADAVAALSTQVSEMVAALKKQITSLTNLVIKIQKKVRA
jgi:trimeric autotransporter adhesin